MPTPRSGKSLSQLYEEMEEAGMIRANLSNSYFKEGEAVGAR